MRNLNVRFFVALFAVIIGREGPIQDLFADFFVFNKGWLFECGMVIPVLVQGRILCSHNGFKFFKLVPLGFIKQILNLNYFCIAETFIEDLVVLHWNSFHFDIRWSGRRCRRASAANYLRLSVLATELVAQHIELLDTWFIAVGRRNIPDFIMEGARPDLAPFRLQNGQVVLKRDRLNLFLFLFLLCLHLVFLCIKPQLINCWSCCSIVGKGALSASYRIEWLGWKSQDNIFLRLFSLLLVRWPFRLLKDLRGILDLNFHVELRVVLNIHALYRRNSLVFIISSNIEINRHFVWKRRMRRMSNTLAVLKCHCVWHLELGPMSALLRRLLFFVL